jgi:hypothetical protein
MRTAIMLTMLVCATGALTTGCPNGDEATLFHCTYEHRATECGGTNWSAWETECYEFDLEDYEEGWDADRVCDKFSGSDTACGGGCCIYVEYQNNVVAEGGCSD